MRFSFLELVFARRRVGSDAKPERRVDSGVLGEKDLSTFLMSSTPRAHACDNHFSKCFSSPKLSITSRHESGAMWKRKRKYVLICDRFYLQKERTLQRAWESSDCIGGCNTVAILALPPGPPAPKACLSSRGWFNRLLAARIPFHS